MAEAGGDNEKRRQDGLRRVSLIAAIAHPLRRQILRLAHDSDSSVSSAEMAADLRVSQGSVVYHTTILEQLGGLTPVGEERVRGAIEDDPPLEALLDETPRADDTPH